MLIVSNYKDYYDYVAKGTESLPVYNRTSLSSEDLNVYVDGKYPEHYVVGCRMRPDAYYAYLTKSEVLVVAGVGYGYAYSRKNYFADWVITSFAKLDNPYYVSLANKVGLPVFLVTDLKPKYPGHVVVIDKVIPVLKNYKFSMFRTAGEVFQDISQFLSYRLPLDPPVSVDNRDKIVKAGFDLKTSFRGKL
jgi:hypothetical protein